VTWHVTRDSAVTVAPGALATRPLRLTAPGALTEPYYLRSPRRSDLYTWPSVDGVAGLPFDPPLSVPFDVDVAGAPVRCGARSRSAPSARSMVSRRPIRVVPAVSLLLDRAVAVRRWHPRHRWGSRCAWRKGGHRSRRTAAAAARGWSAAQDRHRCGSTPGKYGRPLRRDPPAGLRAGSYEIAAVFRDAAGHEYARGFKLIDYPHIQPYRCAPMRARLSKPWTW
jgi:hypothetical protein